MIAALIDGVASDRIAVDNRGLAYGDGIFRTLRMENREVVDFDLHYAKLSADCAALKLACPSADSLRADAAALGIDTCVLKWLIVRNAGGRGYSPLGAHGSRRISLAFALPAYPPQYYAKGVRVRSCDLRLAHQPALAGIKHLNRLENVLARGEWDNPDIAEGLLFDHHDALIGGTMSNVFVLYGHRLVTPPVDRAGVAGVTRARILAAATALDAEVSVAPVARESLASANAIFVCNSVIGVWPVRALDQHVYAPHPLYAQLRRVIMRDSFAST